MNTIVSYIKLKEMKLWEDLDMEEVYNVLSKKQEKLQNPCKPENMIFQIKEKYKIKINYIFVETITFEINGLEFDNYYKQILKFKLKLTNGDNIDVEIICVDQVKAIKTIYKFNQLLLYCHQCDQYYDINIIDLYQHREHKDVFLKEGNKLTRLSKSEFANFFKEQSGCIGKKYKPLDFEPNFKNYFQKSEFIIKKDIFQIYEDTNQNRCRLFQQISFSNVSGTLSQFFGQPGKGKTVTLILFLKYIISHKNFGTLYLNCKALNEKKNSIEMKKIILDEIPYLFYEDYEGYLMCEKILDDYDNNKDNSVFTIINKVIDFLIEKKGKSKYLIALDQYNDKIDPENKELNKLYEKIILPEFENISFGLITFSSMNNKDIREYKLEVLDSEYINKNNFGLRKRKIEIKI